jgi:hypothetical protein
MFFQEYTHTDTKILLFQCRRCFPKYHHYDLGNNNMVRISALGKDTYQQMTTLKYLRKLLTMVMKILPKIAWKSATDLLLEV